MSGGIPTDDQLRGIEQRVLTRIRRRAAARRRIASGAVVAALVVGAVVLVRPVLTTGATGSASSAGSAAGGSGGDRTAESSAEAVRCHVGSTGDAPVRFAPLPAHPTAASVAAACVAAVKTPTFSAVDVVACRTAKGAWEVFRADGHRATLCTRNGLKAG